MADIFISWRSNDAPAMTDRIHEYLGSRLGTESVFRDMEKIRLGEDFEDFKNDVVSLVQTLRKQFPSIGLAVRGSTRRFDEFSFSLWEWAGKESVSADELEEPGTRVVEAVVGALMLILMISAIGAVALGMFANDGSTQIDPYGVVFSMICLLLGMFAAVFGFLRSQLLELLTGALGVLIFFLGRPGLRVTILVLMLTTGLFKLGPIIQREIARRRRELGRD